MSSSQTPAEHSAGRFFKSIPHMNETGIRLARVDGGKATLVLPARPGDDPVSTLMLSSASCLTT